MPSLRVTAGTLRGRRIAVPPLEVRPTSERARQAYFNIVGARIQGARFLDLFAGSGVFSFEAVSRGAAAAVAVEDYRKNVAAIKQLAAEWHAGVTVVARDVFAALPKLQGRFDLVYADPPYDFGRYDELVEAIGPVVSEGGLVAVEHRRSLVVDGWSLVERGSAPIHDQSPTTNKLRPSRTAEYGEVSITFFTQ
jgi:16S rRNA (guanine(966)-N(2))-methyltransferase RsmD